MRTLAQVTTVRERVGALVTGAVEYEPGLDALVVAPAAEVDPVLVAVLHDAFAARWRGGWQPVELQRLVVRRGQPAHAHLVADAVAAHLRPLPRAVVDRRWREQAGELGADVWWTDAGRYLEEFGSRWNLDRVTVLDAVLTLLGVLAGLPPVEVLIPPPGTTPGGNGRSPSGGRGAASWPEDGHGPRIDTRLLGRVRALLAKAESTTYPAEAEAYTAKAQELVARHSLDEALLVARAGSVPVVPFARRICVDQPYEGEKAALLQAVARANRCHTVWSPELGFATLFGFDVDIDAVDLLHTSLLVQAHRAMSRTEPPGGKANRVRLRAFRQSFLVAFAVRIGERLVEATAAALAAATSAAATSGAATSDGTSAGDPTGAAVAAAGPAALLPVLASRDEQVRRTMRRVFPRTVRSRGSRVDSREGWDSGRDAAERAALHQAVSVPAGGASAPAGGR
jgi:hypothetical protein